MGRLASHAKELKWDGGAEIQSLLARHFWYHTMVKKLELTEEGRLAKT